MTTAAVLMVLGLGGCTDRGDWADTTTTVAQAPVPDIDVAAITRGWDCPLPEDVMSTMDFMLLPDFVNRRRGFVEMGPAQLEAVIAGAAPTGALSVGLEDGVAIGGAIGATSDRGVVVAGPVADRIREIRGSGATVLLPLQAGGPDEGDGSDSAGFAYFPQTDSVVSIFGCGPDGVSLQEWRDAEAPELSVLEAFRLATLDEAPSGGATFIRWTTEE